jgi:hypothetical protein
MKHYLLLRDNKETGPLTYEEILQMGLKAYDLIWVDGRSAAWRYPGELPEFKDFAPLVTEQPFDRLLRKPMAEESSASVPENTPLTERKPAPRQLQDADLDGRDADIPTLSRFMQEQSKANGGSDEPGSPAQPNGVPRYVSIKLPSVDEDRPVVVIQSRPGSGDHSSAPPTPSTPAPVEDRPGRRTAALFPERDPSAPALRPAKPRRDIPILQYLAVVVGILSFLGLGMLIGIKWTKARLAEKELADRSTSESSGSLNSPSPSTPEKTLPLPVDSSLTSSAPSDKPALRKLKKNGANTGPLIASSLPQVETAKELDPAVLQEEERKRREAEDKERTRSNINQVIGLQADKYKVGVFGGISDMQVKVSNGSAYPIDLVVVQVDYLQSNKKVFKTETLRFQDLPPHGDQTLELPKTGRGVRVESRITQISSRELDLAVIRN